MTTLSPSLQRQPQLDAWLKINPDGTVTVLTGKVELGQGIKTALAIVAADELDVGYARIRIQTADTDLTPDELYTAGSNSMEHSALAVRQATAQARRIMLELAAQRLEVDSGRLKIEDGTISVTDSGRSNRWTTYWDLMGGKNFDCAVSDALALKTNSGYRRLAARAPVQGLGELVTGSAVFVHDMVLLDMLHARVVRPPHYHARIADVDVEPVKALTGVVEVVRDGSFIAVIAKREEQVVKAAEKLSRAITWHDTAQLDERDIESQLRDNPRLSMPVADGVPVARPIADKAIPDDAVLTVNASYSRPYHMHASLGPSAALAHRSDSELTVWTHSQGVYPLRSSIAQILKIDQSRLRLVHVPGPGCYGHNGADDAALDAALLAWALPGKPIMLKWSRSDEHTWEPYSSAMLIDLEASLDKGGRVLSWSHETFSDTHIARPRPRSDGCSNLLAAWHLADPVPKPAAQPNLLAHGGIHRNADPLYEFPNRRIVKHLVRDLPLRTSSMRSLGAYGNVFALESFIDELAHAAAIDPLVFRLNHLRDARARAVLETAAKHAGWGEQRVEGCGKGLAFAQYKNHKCYAAVVIDLTVEDDGSIRLKRALISADAGQIVDREGLRNQLEGGLIQAASWTLKEQVTWDIAGITSRDWDQYPILTFAEVPDIETILIDRPGQPFLGSGEATQGPTPAAIANAVYDAVGLRLRRIPFTPDKVLAAAAG